jgi:hypothetical protein
MASGQRIAGLKDIHPFCCKSIALEEKRLDIHPTENSAHHPLNLEAK